MDMIFSSQMLIADCLAFLTECRQPFNRLILVFPVLAGKFTNLPIIPNHQPSAQLLRFLFHKKMAPRIIVDLLDALFPVKGSLQLSFCACCFLHVFLATFYPFESYIHFLERLPPSWVWLYRCECGVYKRRLLAYFLLWWIGNQPANKKLSPDNESISVCFNRSWFEGHFVTSHGLPILDGLWIWWKLIH